MAIIVRASGTVLTGGGSRRMGRDKALLTVGDPPVTLAERVVGALRAGGCPDITCVGGDREALGALGLTTAPDDHPGQGPLGGVLTGLRIAALDLVVVLACDLPAIDGASVRGLVTALANDVRADVAVPLVDGRLQVHAAAFRRACRPRLDVAFAAGERSLTRAITALEVVPVTHLAPAALVDVDSPDDLDR